MLIRTDEDERRPVESGDVNPGRPNDGNGCTEYARLLDRLFDLDCLRIFRHEQCEALTEKIVE
jgi:hypothetical protein